jgi:hypothetical protein
VIGCTHDRIAFHFYSNYLAIQLCRLAHLVSIAQIQIQRCDANDAPPIVGTFFGFGMWRNPVGADFGKDGVVGNADKKEGHKKWPTLQHDFVA